MLPNLQFPVDLVTLTEEILNGKLPFCALKVTPTDVILESSLLTLNSQKINKLVIVHPTLKL